MLTEERIKKYGTVFRNWEIEKRLGTGSGGKTAVFLMRRTESARGVCALKVVTLIEEEGNFRKLSAARRKIYENVRQECTDAAEKEVWLMNELQGNTHIVDYQDHTFLDWETETHYGRDLLIRMEFLKVLHADMKEGKIFSRDEIVRIGIEICKALELCHGQNIIHRDIKPENIFINKHGDYKLGDFGVSRILDAALGSMASTNLGTPEYAAPEQFDGLYDHRVDIYSLGLVLYELSNRNCLPFCDSSYVRREDIEKRIRGGEIPAPRNADAELAKVILKAIAYFPDARYQTAAEFRYALERLQDAPIVIPEETVENVRVKGTSKKKKNPKGYFAAAVFVILAAVAAAVWYLLANAPKGGEEPPEVPTTEATTEAAITETTEPETTVPETTEPAAEPVIMNSLTEAWDIQKVQLVDVAGIEETKDGVRVREGPGFEYKVVRVIKNEDHARVHISEERKVVGNTWVHIEDGWMSKEYVLSKNKTQELAVFFEEECRYYPVPQRVGGNLASGFSAVTRDPVSIEDADADLSDVILLEVHSSDSAYGTVANCRWATGLFREPSAASECVAWVLRHGTVAILETKTQDDGAQWGRTPLGWVNMKYIEYYF